MICSYTLLIKIYIDYTHIFTMILSFKHANTTYLGIPAHYTTSFNLNRRKYKSLYTLLSKCCTFWVITIHSFGFRVMLA